MSGMGWSFRTDDFPWLKGAGIFCRAVFCDWNGLEFFVGRFFVTELWAVGVGNRLAGGIFSRAEGMVVVALRRGRARRSARAAGRSGWRGFAWCAGRHGGRVLFLRSTTARAEGRAPPIVAQRRVRVDVSHLFRFPLDPITGIDLTQSPNKKCPRSRGQNSPSLVFLNSSRLRAFA